MTELQDLEFSVPLKLVSAAARRIDDDMNIVVIFGKGMDSLNCVHTPKRKGRRWITNAIVVRSRHLLGSAVHHFFHPTPRVCP